MGYAREDFMYKPVVGIINTWSDLAQCHTHDSERVEDIKRDGYEPAMKTWRARIPSGAHAGWTSQAVAGFEGYRMAITTPEHEAAFARARAIRDAGIAMLKERGPR
jgi:hypothetical protein